jgi:hypothetical protein
MKKIFSLLTLVLAINFLALAGAVGWIVKTKGVDRAKMMAIKEIIFPTATTQPTTEPVVADEATTQPAIRLDELVARQAGRTAAEQVETIQHSFDAKVAELDRRQREVQDLDRQVDLAKQQMARDRAALNAEKAALKAREDQSTKLASDQGFQDALSRYIAMPPKQVKQIFTTLDDQTVVNYLQAMEPKTAAKIIKEFKTDTEIAQIQRILEKMRQAQASVKE